MPDEKPPNWTLDDTLNAVKKAKAPAKKPAGPYPGDDGVRMDVDADSVLRNPITPKPR